MSLVRFLDAGLARARHVVAGIVALAAAAGWAGGDRSSAHAVVLSDPTGDAACMLTSGGSCAVPYDIKTFEAVYGSSHVIFRAWLAQNIVQAPSVDNAAPEQFGGYIDIDTDQTVATGTFAWGDYFAGAAPWPDPVMKFSGLGVEYYLDLYSEGYHPGFVELWDSPGNFLVSDAIPIIYGTNWFEISVARSLLGNDDGAVAFDIVVGDGLGLTDQATDYRAVQDGGSPAVSTIPAPASLALFGLALTGIGMARRHARSA